MRRSPRPVARYSWSPLRQPCRVATSLSNAQPISTCIIHPHRTVHQSSSIPVFSKKRPGRSGHPRGTRKLRRRQRVGGIEEASPRVHTALSKEVVSDYRLLYTWKGTEANLKPALMRGHRDVVPIEQGYMNPPELNSHVPAPRRHQATIPSENERPGLVVVADQGYNLIPSDFPLPNFPYLFEFHPPQSLSPNPK